MEGVGLLGRGGLHRGGGRRGHHQLALGHHQARLLRRAGHMEPGPA